MANNSVKKTVKYHVSPFCKQQWKTNSWSITCIDELATHNKNTASLPAAGPWTTKTKNSSSVNLMTFFSTRPFKLYCMCCVTIFKKSYARGWKQNTQSERVIVLFPGYLPSPYRSPYWICTQHSACQWSHTNALREVLWQWVGKFLLKSTITLFNCLFYKKLLCACFYFIYFFYFLVWEGGSKSYASVDVKHTISFNPKTVFWSPFGPWKTQTAPNLPIIFAILYCAESFQNPNTVRPHIQLCALSSCFT